MRRKYLKSDLARDLGIDRALITRYGRRGMPCHNLAAAQEWRRMNLDPSGMKPAPAVASSAASSESPGAAAVALDLIRYFAENAERDFATWAEPLRDAMRQLPARYWAGVELDSDLWSRLIGEPALAMLKETEDNLTPEERAAPVIPATAAEALFLLDTWAYQLACGLARVQEPATDERGDA